jgi:hypothetical protein
MKRWRTLVWLLTLALTEPALRLAGRAQTVTDSLPLPAIKSPVDTFRGLLAMTPEQRKQALAGRPEETRQNLLAKLREYEALTPEEQELRLRATELRWWLLPLMRQSATNRVAQLNAIPADLRKLVEERLALWNLFPPPLQKELLEKEETARLAALTAAQREKDLAGVKPERRAELEAGLARWRALTEHQRRATCEQFDSYFNLTADEQGKVLSTLSEAERQQMEQTLRAFENLPRDKRQACVRSFARFANMNLAERQQFLKNAERWRQMPPAEREAWRNLVRTVPDWPPLPPGFGETPPPLPPGLPRTRTPLTTNGG